MHPVTEADLLESAFVSGDIDEATYDELMDEFINSQNNE